MNKQDRVLPLRERAVIKDKWLMKRFETVLPQIMTEEDIDLWIVTSQESNEDPVMKTLIPSPMLTSGRRTMLVFFKRQDGTVERISISKPGFALDKMYKSVWISHKDGDWSQFSSISPDKGILGNNVGAPETQMECLTRIINERSPKKIGLNFCEDNAFGDGLSHGAYTLIAESLGTENCKKIVSAQRLCTRWLETRTPEEIAAYKGIVRITADIMKEALSEQVILPGITTAADLEWWIMEKAESLGLKPWFPFMVAIRRNGAIGLSGDVIIQEGDIIHCDVGVEYLGLCSDLQDNAYILRRGETEPPKGLTDLFAQGCRMQDILAEEMQTGRLGNEILASALERAKAEGIRPMLYSHPLGNYGHSAGMTIGRVDNQKFVKGVGEYPLYENTAYAMELNVVGSIPEWNNQDIMMGIETDIIFTGGKVEYLYRQHKLHYVK